MTAISSTGLSSLPGTAVPAIDAAHEPAVIRNGGPAAKHAYQVALSFEQLLVDQLSQQLAATTTDSSASDGSSDGASGLMGNDPTTNAYASMLPQTLTDSIMSGGGTGVALQLATALDPALRGKS